MRPHFFLSALAGIAGFTTVTSAAEQNTTHITFPVHQRFLSRSNTSPPSKWSHRGDIIYTKGSEGSAKFQKTNDAGAKEINGEGDGWYQLAICSDTDSDRWPIGSTKACFLANPGGMHLDVQIDGDKPVGLSIYPSNVPSSGECPPSTRKSTIELPTGPESGLITVNIIQPERISSPSLAPPPVVDSTTGLPTPPPVEKSFLQKYWLPLLGLAFFAVSQMAGGSEPNQAEGGRAR